MTREQMETFRAGMGVAPGEEWDRFAGLDIAEEELEAFLSAVPFASAYPRRHAAARIAVPERIDPPDRATISTQDGFGRILNDIARGGGELAGRIVTTSPDVAVSTNLGPWVNRRGIFSRDAAADTYAEEDVLSPQRWAMSPGGQHVELGIAENNLFLTLSAFGLAAPIFGERLLPIGTLYDPFIRRGLDALHYACYQDARFMLVATPSGITLAPEGGAHQSQETPLITLGQAGLAAFEPAFVDELAEIMEWGFRHMQADDGGSVALRLSTRAIRQPAAEARAAEDWRAGAIRGAYWRAGPSCDGAPLAVAYMGAMAPEAEAAVEALREDVPDAGLLAIASPDRLHEDWIRARQARVAGDAARTAPIETLLARGSRPTPPWSPCSTATRRRCRGSARSPGTASTRSASTTSASRATSPTCMRATASTSTPSWTPPPAPRSAATARRPADPRTPSARAPGDPAKRDRPPAPPGHPPKTGNFFAIDNHSQLMHDGR